MDRDEDRSGVRVGVDGQGGVGPVDGRVGVVSGILIGILASRTISGLVAGAAGWRAIYALAAVVDIALAILLFRVIPPLTPKTRMPYPALIASVAAVVLRERAVRWTLTLSATGFAVFTMFWTSLTFLLSGPPYSYPVSVIGLFGLVGLAGAIAAQRAGHLHDRGWSLPATGAAWALTLVSFGIAALGGHSLVFLLIAILILDIALQAQSILNQTRIFAISAEARSRLSTAYVTTNFVGGAIGSAAAAVLWSAGGWTAISAAGVVLSSFALLVWAAGRRGDLIVANTQPGHTLS